MIPRADTEARADQVEHIVRDLVPRASQLTRLVLGQTRGQISRSEGGILRTLTATVAERAQAHVVVLHPAAGALGSQVRLAA